ncbi:bifunctional tetrahydrofolate synthase/dihydrofolate synthase [Marinobacteraceae bacterium S3BR75-40.1]
MNPPKSNASLDEWLSYLESLHPKTMDLGLDRVLLVLRRLFPRRPDARIITIAGTNGKGSTAAALESLLRARGRTTGLYTSPHILAYNERARINGQAVGDAALIDAFQRIEAARGNVSLTYFEFGTLAAFLLFADSNVDDWVLEVGLGGRLDAVNSLDPDLAIITSVAIDHSDWLGNDRVTIGFEKAGILRPGITALYGEADAPSSVLQQALAQKVQLYRAGQQYDAVNEGDGRARIRYQWKGESRELKLPVPALPLPSVASAIQALALLGEDPQSVDIMAALKFAPLQGRFEIVRDAPRVILDVGHNPHAAGWLAGRLQDEACQGRTFAVYAGLADKDTVGVFQALSPVIDRWLPALLSEPRALERAALRERLESAGLGDSPVYDTVAAALSAALEGAAAEDRVIVLGSFYTVAEAKRALTDGAKGTI